MFCFLFSHNHKQFDAYFITGKKGKKRTFITMMMVDGKMVQLIDATIER